MAFIEALPGRSKPRVGEKVWTRKVLPTRSPVFMVLIRANDESCHSKPHLVLGLLFMLNLKPMLEEEDIVHG